MYQNRLLGFLVTILVMFFFFCPHSFQIKENYRGYSLKANIGIGVAVFFVIAIIAVHFVPDDFLVNSKVFPEMVEFS